MKKVIISLMCAITVLSGCGNMSNLSKGSLIGGTGGAAVGAGIGALIGEGKGAAIGAAIGSVVGAGAGAIIGNKMDKKAEELAAIQGASIDTVTDVNNLKSIKVTFDSGILFPTNGTTLSDASKDALKKFATTMADMPDTDLTIQGHTDNTGSRAVNDRISLQRAEAVSNYLKSCGMNADRFAVEGLAYDVPVATNDTAEGRAQNRRVEIYITANEQMIADAEKAAN
ncbi:MAG: OmpA family protein [Bacteroidales bacterium]|nr:OmpA family protein [Bacteroidales bacterium]